MPKAEKARTITLSICGVTTVLIIIVFCTTIGMIKRELNADYESGKTDITNGNYQAAIDTFDMLGEDYRDAQKYKDYARAIKLFEEGNYAEAQVIFESLGDFEESENYLKDTNSELEKISLQGQYNEACRYYVEQKYSNAYFIFNSLGDYENSQQLAEESKQKWRLQCSDVISAGIRSSVGITENGRAKFSSGDFFVGKSDIEQHWSNLISVSACSEFVLGLKNDGTVLVAKRKLDSQYDYSIDISKWNDIIDISSGEQFVVGLKSDGTLTSAGIEGYGEREDLNEWKNIVAIDTGWQHTVGLDQDGKVHVAGYHSKELLDEISLKADEWTDIVAISTGGSTGYENGKRHKGEGHIVALRKDGKVVAVGDNTYGQCEVDNWKDIVAISAGDYHTVGLTKDGKVLSTDKEGDSIYSNNEINNQWSLEQFKAVSAGYGFTLGVKTDGSVVNAGYYKNGQANVGTWKIMVDNILE